MNSIIGKSFLRVLKENKKITGMLMAAIIGIVLTSLIPPQILKQIIDGNLMPQKKEGLLLLAIEYICVIVLIGVFDFLKEAVLTILGQKITTGIRYDMMRKLEKVQMGFFSISGSGTIVSRFINDVDAINSIFTNGIVGMVIDCFKIVGIIISVWIFSAKLGMITLALIPVIYAITRFFQKRMLKAQIQNRILVGRVNNHIGESIKNIHMIKSYSKETYMEEKYKEHLLENYKTVEKVNFYDSVFSPIIQVLRAVVIGAIVLISSRQLNFLGISIGMVAAAIELISNLFAPIEQLGMELQNIQQAISGIYRVNAYFQEAEDEEKDKSYQADVTTISREIMLEFQNLSFQYEEGNDILKDVNICIHPLEKVTFIGRTGVGKSTLFKLILGLLKPTSGSIRVNSIDVYQIPNEEKRKLFGYVDQSFHTIRGTIAEQISLKDPAITREQVEKALDYVGILDYVNSLDYGCDTELFSQGLFSQGQKQLLSIARAIVTNPPILLLDEITANLDSITEEKIVRVLQKASSSHMILSISHRLSSIVANDTVVILEEGRIRNSGSPEVLLQSDDWYKSQMALENLTWS